MSSKLIILYFTLVKYCGPEPPTTICSNEFPIRTKENICANFSEVCVKKDDENCDLFQNACKQCLPSNYSILVYLDMINVKGRLTQLEQTIRKLSDEQMRKTKQRSHRSENLLIVIIVIVILAIVLLIVLFVIFIYKLFSKLKKNLKEPCIENQFSQNNLYTTIISKINDLKSFVEEDLTKSINDLRGYSAEKIHKIKFQVEGEKEPVELLVLQTHCVVGVKKEICNKLTDKAPHWYKIMKLIYNKKDIDNNQYFLSCLLETNSVVTCKLDRSVNNSLDVVVNLKSNVEIPELFQMKQDQTIAQLKEMITSVTKLKDIVVNKDLIELKDHGTMKDYDIKDYTCLTIIEKKNGKLNIKNACDESQSVDVMYCNTEPVFSILRNIGDQLRRDKNNFFLFTDGECMNENKYIYEYNINSRSKIMYYYILSTDDIKLEENSIDKGYLAELFRGEQVSTKTNLLVMKYKILEAYLQGDREFIKGFIELQIKKSYSKKSFGEFLQVVGIFKDEDHLYIAFENADGGTLTKYINDNHKISDRQIARWSKKILKCLQCIHNDGIFFRYLKPYDIFINGSGIKMHNLTLSKFVYQSDMWNRMEQLFDTENYSLAYVAPEIREKKDHDHTVDIWSFGVVLIHIVIGECPNISVDNTFKYLFPSERPSELKDLIDSCVKVNPQERETVKKLLNHPFITKFSNV